MDLKYIRDFRGKRYVFLSMLDTGTSFHQAVMLKTRQSGYVASKWFRRWVSQFGPPGKIAHDQGGEFEAGFTALLEELSVPSTVTGTHSGWQLSLAERHARDHAGSYCGRAPVGGLPSVEVRLGGCSGCEERHSKPVWLHPGPAGLWS